MDNLSYNNGIVFWTEEQIRIRNMFQDAICNNLNHTLISMNPAFRMIRCEAPILTPQNLISSSYNENDYYQLPDNLSLRPETTMGSYEYAKHILNTYHSPKYKLPICVWQHGKSFRREQDQPSKHIRLKEFYQLEFQILFSESTAFDYYNLIVASVKNTLADFLQRSSKYCYTVASDRLPSYSTETTDIVLGVDTFSGIELCSISRRTDYKGAKNIEVAVGTDRCVLKYQEKMADIREIHL